MAKQIKVTLVHSGINRPQRQKQTILGLGLTKINQSRILLDTPSTRGMIRKISHLIRIEAAE